MRTWDVFFSRVLPDVMGCPEPTVETHLLDAARRFCAETLCWREDLPTVTTEAGVRDYPIFYPAGATGVRAEAVTINGFGWALEARNETSAADRQNGTGCGDRALIVDMKNVQLSRIPPAGLPLILTMLLQPSEEAKGVPDFIADRYRLAIANGALSTLLVVNGAPWANVGLAGSKALKFEEAIGDARKSAWKANSNRRPRSRAIYF